MDCPHCHAQNPDDARFCGDCGADLKLACATCGASLTAAQKFCRTCGTPVAAGPAAPARFATPQSYTPRHLAERILTSRAALEGERKQVSVLFSDLKGSMELLADRDPEQARKLLDPVLERMMEAVHRYEGTVNQVMGDGIMALFGAPLAHEDHAVRACYAALRMQQAIGQYADELRRAQGLDVQIRVGINSGEVVVRSVGSDLRMDYTAVGPTTHLAARMEQLARPGTTLLSADTLKLAEGYVQVRTLGPMPVKGVAQPVEVFELTGAGSARTRLQAAAARGLTRFVGRQRELEVLAEALADASQSKGQVAAIVGEAGVGKSRLYYEFLHSHRTQGWLVLESGSVSYGKATPYLPVIDLLKGYFHIGDRDDARAIREKVTGKLLTLDRSLEALLSPLLSLLDQPVDDPDWQRLDPPQRRRHTLDALKRLWLREAQAQPLVLVFEDLHWIDSETQEFLDGLLDSVQGTRLLLLFNYRPEYRHPWGGKSFYTQLRLDALSAESAEELLAGVLGANGELDPLKRLLIERTQGNALFLEESVRGLVEAGALDGDKGAYRLAKPLASIEVPATVQSILAARIDRLAAEDKRLLQTAAVIGKDVPFAILQAIADLSEDALRQGLANLQAAEFVYEASLFPDLEYTFKHALTHDVAYGSLLQDRRRELHGRIVQAIETLYAERLDEQVERLAYHAHHAELWDKALRYARQAAAKASSRWAFREAARYLELALEVLNHMPDRDQFALEEIDIRLELRMALVPAAAFDRAAEVLERAARLAERVGDMRRLAWAEAYRAFIGVERNQIEEASRAGRRALSLAEDLGDRILMLSARHFLTGICHTTGDFQGAISLGHPALEVDDELVAGVMAKGVYSAMPYFLLASEAELGLFADALTQGETLMRRARASGNPFAIELMCVQLGFIHVRRGTPTPAIALLEQGVELCDQYALDVQVPWTKSTLGLAHALAGHQEEGIRYAQEAVTRGEQLGFTRYQPLRIAFLSNAYLLADRQQDSHVTARQALALARRYQEKGAEAWALYLAAASQAAMPGLRATETRDAYVDALRMSEGLAMRPLVAHCHLGLGQLYAQNHEKTAALEHMKRALAMYREMSMQHWPDKAEALLSGLQGR